MAILKIIFDKYNRASLITTGSDRGISSTKPLVEYWRDAGRSYRLKLASVFNNWKDFDHRRNMLTTLQGEDEILATVPSTFKGKTIPGLAAVVDDGAVTDMCYYLSPNIDINFIDKETDIKWSRSLSDDVLATNVEKYCFVETYGLGDEIRNTYKNQFYTDWLIAYVYAINSDKSVTRFERVKYGDKCKVLAEINSMDYWKDTTLAKKVHEPKYYVVRTSISNRLVLITNEMVKKLHISLVNTDSVERVVIPWSIVSIRPEADSDGAYAMYYSLNFYKLLLISYTDTINFKKYMKDVYERMHSYLIDHTKTIDKSDSSEWKPGFRFKYYAVGKCSTLDDFVAPLKQFYYEDKPLKAETAKKVETHINEVKAAKETNRPAQTKPVEIPKKDKKVTGEYVPISAMPPLERDKILNYRHAFLTTSCMDILTNVTNISDVDITNVYTPDSDLEIVRRYKVIHGNSAIIVGYDVIDHKTKKKFRLAYKSADFLVRASLLRANLGSYSKNARHLQILTPGTTDILINDKIEEPLTFINIVGDVEKYAKTPVDMQKLAKIDSRLNRISVHMTKAIEKPKAVEKPKTVENNTDKSVVKSENILKDISPIEKLLATTESKYLSSLAKHALRKYGNIYSTGLRFKIKYKVLNNSDALAGYILWSNGYSFDVDITTTSEFVCLGLVDAATIKGAGRTARIITNYELPIMRLLDIPDINSDKVEAYLGITRKGEDIIRFCMSSTHKNELAVAKKSIETTVKEVETKAEKVGLSSAEINSNNNIMVRFNQAHTEYMQISDEKNSLDKAIALAESNLLKLKARREEVNTKLLESREKLNKARKLLDELKY